MGAPDSLYSPVPAAAKVVAHVNYWKVVSEHMAQPMYVSALVEDKDMLVMVDALSREHQCPILLQKISKQGYGDEKVVWQRYLINGLSSFGSHSFGETHLKKKAKVLKKRAGVRSTGKP